LLSAIFRGSIKSCVKAKGVKSAAPSITVQPFTMLHLDILDSVRSIEDALDHMTHTEVIHGGYLLVFPCVLLLFSCAVNINIVQHGRSWHVVGC
jgi:hypothetical protein